MPVRGESGGDDAISRRLSVSRFRRFVGDEAPMLNEQWQSWSNSALSCEGGRAWTVSVYLKWLNESCPDDVQSEC